MMWLFDLKVLYIHLTSINFILTINQILSEILAKLHIFIIVFLIKTIKYDSNSILKF